MRGPRKKAKEQAIKDQALLKKSSLNIKLLPENETDAKLASMMRLNPATTSEEKEAKLREDIVEDSIFSSRHATSSSSSKDIAINDMKKAVQRKKEDVVNATPKAKTLGVILKKDKKRTSSLALLSNDYATSSSNDDE